MWRVVLIALVVTTASATSHAGRLSIDDLEPSAGIHAEYGAANPRTYAKLKALLGEHDMRTCQMFVEPAFHPEWVVYIAREQYGRAAPKLVYKALKKSQSPQPSSESIETEVRVGPIDERLAQTLDEVWFAMLLRTRYAAHETRGLDGVTFHFAHFVAGKGYLSGEVWFPDASSLPGKLAAIGERLKDLAMSDGTGRKSIENELRETAKALLKELKP